MLGHTRSPNGLHAGLGQKEKSGLCAKSLPDNFSKIAVDHNHATSEVRSLVHVYCNVAIGVYENYATELSRYVKVYGEN